MPLPCLLPFLCLQCQVEEAAVEAMWAVQKEAAGAAGGGGSDGGVGGGREGSSADAAGGGAAETLREQLGAAAAALRAQLLVLPSEEQEPHVQQRFAQLQGAEHAAVAAMALLQRWWQQQDADAGMEKVAAVALAQAAATRSCANLRCPSLALQGGPDAKQGVGCKCCSTCRAVW